MRIFTIILLFCTLLIMPQFQTDVEAKEQTACYKKNNGQFRIVDYPEDCNPSEYSLEFEVKDDGELEVDFCFKNGDCTLNLDLNTDDALFSVIGSETCQVDDTTVVERHIYGSGFAGSDGIRIGLTFTGIGSHEGRVFILDLQGGLCDADISPCCDPLITECEDGVPPYTYTPTCSEPE